MKLKIKKMNKKGFVFTTGLIIILLVIGAIVILPLLISGGLAFPVLNKIPAPVWIILGVILLFKLVGGKKK